MTRDEILLKIQYAKNFTLHKIEYYKEMLKEFDSIKTITDKRINTKPCNNLIYSDILKNRQ